MRRTLRVVLFSSVSLLLAGAGMVVLPVSAARAATTTLVANLTGTLEVPSNASPGTGTATVVLDTTLHTMAVNVTFSGLLGTTTASHIHCCLSSPFLTGVNVGVATATPTFPGFPLGVTAGSYSMVFDLTATTTYNPAFITSAFDPTHDVAGAEAALVAGIMAGETYLNIHTSLFSGGEIRGFLAPASQQCPAAFTPVGALEFDITANCVNGDLITSASVTCSPASNTASCTVSGPFPGPQATWQLTKINASFRLQATMTADIQLVGGGKLTLVIDPLFTTLAVNTGHAIVQTFSDIPRAEHYIAVTNGNPGLKGLAIRVNGKYFRHLNLTGTASVINVDATSVMTQDKNAISFIGSGDLGSFANIVVGDAVPAARSAAPKNAGTWGPLVDSVDDNTSDQVAIGAKEEIQLSLATSLDLRSAVTASNYVVTVNGSPVSYLQVSATPSAGETTLVLRLPTRSFVAGDAIQVNWNGLKNSKGQLLSGQVDLIAQ